MPRAWWWLGCACGTKRSMSLSVCGLFVESRSPLAGCPAPPFIDQGEQGLHGGGRIKNQRPRRSPKSVGSSSSSRTALPLTQPDGVRGGAFIGYACIDNVMPYKWSRPIPSLWAASRIGVSACETGGGANGAAPIRLSLLEHESHSGVCVRLHARGLKAAPTIL